MVVEVAPNQTKEPPTSGSSFSKALIDSFRISQQLLAELDISTYGSEKAIRPGHGDKVFPDPSRGHKYYMEQIAIQDIAGRQAAKIAGTIQLEWTGALRIPERIREVICSSADLFFLTPAFLVPVVIMSGNCFCRCLRRSSWSRTTAAFVRTTRRVWLV